MLLMFIIHIMILSLKESISEYKYYNQAATVFILIKLLNVHIPEKHKGNIDIQQHGLI